MPHLKLISSLVVFLFGISACTGVLEEPRSSAQPTAEGIATVADMDLLITGAYAGIARETAHSGNALLMGELMADLLSTNNANYRNSPSRASRVHTFSQREEENGFMAEYLQATASSLVTVNEVLAIIRKNQIPENTQESDPRKQWAKQRNRIEGEARLLRAVVMFEQTRHLGYPWGYKADNTQAGPIGSYESIGSFEAQDYPRMSVKMAYDSLLTDLRLAERLLPEAFDAALHPLDFQPRGNKYAALALMARVYAQQDNLDSCLSVCNRLLGRGTDYRFPLVKGSDMLAKLFQRSGQTANTNSTNRDEVIFEMVHIAGKNARTTSAAPLRVHYVLQTPYINLNAGNIISINSGPNVRMSQRFKTLTNFDRSRDLRYRTLIDTTQGAVGSLWNNPSRLWYSRKFGTQGVGTLGVAQGVNTNVVLMRAAEFVLLRAEVLARLGNIAGAVADLNAIRTRAGLVAYTSAPNNLIDEIRTERARELFTEGQRLHDLKRWKQTIDLTDRRQLSGGTDCASVSCQDVPWNSKYLFYLIPQSFLDRNRLAVQNE